jgi:hypothetical protein
LQCLEAWLFSVDTMYGHVSQGLSADRETNCAGAVAVADTKAEMLNIIIRNQSVRAQLRLVHEVKDYH